MASTVKSRTSPAASWSAVTWLPIGSMCSIRTDIRAPVSTSMPTKRTSAPTSMRSSAMATGSRSSAVIDTAAPLLTKDEAALCVGVALDVALSGLDRSMTGQELNVTKAGAGAMCIARSIGNEGPPAGM
jgi:hypothetical protein